MYYSCLSVSEGLDTETNELQMNLERFDKNVHIVIKYLIS